MTPEEQLETTIRHFNMILPLPLPKGEKGWKLINTETVLKTLKPVATILIHNNSRYVLKAVEGFGMLKKIAEMEAKNYANVKEYEFTFAVKRGTNFISITKCVDEKGEFYTMYCIPINDREMMDKTMRDMKKQGNEDLMLLLKEQLNNLSL